MAYNPINPNGQALSADSAPVVLSTEQEAILESTKDAVATSAVYLNEIRQRASITNPNGQQVNADSQPVTLSLEQQILLDQQIFHQSNIYDKVRLINEPHTGSATFTAGGGIGQTLVIDAKGVSILTVQTVSTGWTGSVLTLQGSNDGITWTTIGANNTNVFMNVNTSAQTATIAAGSTGMFKTDISGFVFVRLTNLAAITAGSVAIVYSASNANPHVVNIGAQNNVGNPLNVNLTSNGGGHLMKQEDTAHVNADIGVGMFGVRQDALSVLTSATGDYGFFAMTKFGANIIKDEERHKRTYFANAVFAAANLATDILTISSNAGANIISINRILIQGFQTTGSNVDLYLYKRTTANTGGTSTTETAAKANEGDAASTAVIKSYTANPSALGTQAGGTLRVLNFLLPTSGSAQPIFEINFGERGKPIQLRNGVQDSLSLNLGGVTYAGNRFYVYIEWTEE